MVLLVVLAASSVFVTRAYYWRQKAGVTASRHPEPNSKRESAVAEPDTYSAGQRVTLDAVPFILASAKGTDMTDVSGSHSVEEASNGHIYGNQFERAYFGGGKNFVEKVFGHGAVQIRIFSLIDERFPANADEWAFFIGGADRDAYIGLPSIDYGDNNRHYERVWSPQSGEAVKPVNFVENYGLASAAKHDAMLYDRPLDESAKPPLMEYLCIERVVDGGGASIKVWVGIDVAPMAVRVA